MGRCVSISFSLFAAVVGSLESVTQKPREQLYELGGYPYVHVHMTLFHHGDKSRSFNRVPNSSDGTTAIMIRSSEVRARSIAFAMPRASFLNASSTASCFEAWEEEGGEDEDEVSFREVPALADFRPLAILSREVRE